MRVIASPSVGIMGVSAGFVLGPDRGSSPSWWRIALVEVLHAALPVRLRGGVLEAGRRLVFLYRVLIVFCNDSDLSHVADVEP